MKVAFLVLTVLIVSCSSNADLIAVNKHALLTDNNSKVWLVDKVIVGTKNFAPLINSQKDILIFYDNGHCAYQNISRLGDYPAKKGDFSLYADDSSLFLHFQNETWRFRYQQLSEDTISLLPEKNSDLNYQLILVPFPEL